MQAVFHAHLHVKHVSARFFVSLVLTIITSPQITRALLHVPINIMEKSKPKLVKSVLEDVFNVLMRRNVSLVMLASYLTLR